MMEDSNKLHIEGLHYYEGIPLPGVASGETVRKVRHLPLYKGDVLMCGYLKSGTVWITNVVAAILSADDLDLFVKTGTRREMVPIEVDVGFESLTTAPRPAILKSHLHYRHLPEEVEDDDKVKVIYVMRNPKDVAVSLFNFCKTLYALGPYVGTWDAFLETFLHKDLPLGSWFDHLRTWKPHFSRPHVMTVMYEQCLGDPHAAIRAMADFLGRTLTSQQVERIAEITSAEFMKKTPPLQFEPVDVPPRGENIPEKIPFIRKAMVGDWKNYFTQEQNSKFDQYYSKFAQETELNFQFE